MPLNGQIRGNRCPVSKPSKEYLYYIKRVFFDLFGFVFLLICLPFLWVYNFIFPSSKKKVMVGTHPIVSNIHYKELLIKSLPEYEIDIFIFEDWLGENNYYDISAKKILPTWIVGNNAYGFAPYIIFLWALRNYRGFFLHLDGAILERTLLWRIEPLLLELFGKKIIMQAYGTDQWTILQSNDNLNFKLGLTRHRNRYFMMDLKKIKRNYMWSQYVDLIVGDIRYIPITSGFSLAHYYIELEELPYNFNENLDPIIISHFANHPERKGSNAIEEICNELIEEGFNIEYKSVHGVPREEALSILDDSHIFIEQIFNGIIGTGSLEAMAKGNVVLSNIDERLIELALVQDYKFYSTFFKKFPIRNVNILTLKEELIKLIHEKELLEDRVIKSREFIEMATKNVEGLFSNKKDNGIRKIYDEAK